MQHTWNEETNTCERCGLVKVIRKRKVQINPKFQGTYDQYYSIYYSKGNIESEIALKCFYPGQYKLNFIS